MLHTSLPAWAASGHRLGRLFGHELNGCAARADEGEGSQGSALLSCIVSGIVQWPDDIARTAPRVIGLDWMVHMH